MLHSQSTLSGLQGDLWQIYGLSGFWYEGEDVHIGDVKQDNQTQSI